MRWPPEQLPAIREAELAACLEILGIKEHRWLGYPDGRCADADGHAAAEQIAEISPDSTGYDFDISSGRSDRASRSHRGAPLDG